MSEFGNDHSYSTMAVIDASNILPVLAASTVMLVFILKIYLTLRTKFPVKVNCWFCNSNTKVPYINHNSWYCPHCEQYNGFTKDGGYNRPMVEHYNSEFNHRTWNTKVKPVVKQQNSLCRVCNINQELKVAQLAQFTPFDPNNFDYEVEQYSNKLEKAYRLCPQCEVKLKETLERKRYLFKGLNVEDAQKIISTAIRTVQKGNKICTVSTGIVSGCLFLSGVNYFITNSWLYVYLQQTAEEILLAVNIPEFLMYSRDSGVISTLISWLSAQTDWINSKLAASEVSVSSVLTGIGTLLQCVDCMQQRNISTMLNLTSWSILFGLSLSPVLNQTAVLIKAVEMSAAFVFFVLSTVNIIWRHEEHKSSPNVHQSSAATECENRTETGPKKSKLPDPLFTKPSSSVGTKPVFSVDSSTPLEKTCPSQGGRSSLRRLFEDEDFGFSGLNISSRKEKCRSVSASPGFEAKVYGAQIPVDLFRPKSPILTPPKLSSTEKSFNLSSALSSTSNAPLTRSSSQSSGFGSMNQPILESCRVPSVAGGDFDSVSEPGGYVNPYHSPPPYQQSLYPYHPFQTFHPSSLPFIHLAAAHYHQLYSAAAILDRSSDSLFSNSRFSSNSASSSYQNVRNTLYSPLILLLILSNLLLLTFVMYKELFIASKV